MLSPGLHPASRLVDGVVGEAHLITTIEGVAVRLVEGPALLQPHRQIRVGEIGDAEGDQVGQILIDSSLGPGRIIAPAQDDGPAERGPQLGDQALRDCRQAKGRLVVDVQIGDELEVTGYWENDEFKASEITLLASGQTIVLRDELGRPSWSGSQQAGRGAQADLLQTGRQGNASGAAAASSEGWGGNGRNGSASEFTQGTGQAVVNEWILLQGAAVSIDENALIVKLPSGELITIENRPWWFIQDQGFSAEVGDEIELSGFYEGEDFETGQLTNLTKNLTVDVREYSGRPLWAGGGQSS